jgi:hypothetical protein
MPKSTPVKRAARHMHPMDIHIGQRIRQRRILLGMSMWNLGAAVGLSFQMIQKYEAGLSSVAAAGCLGSRLSTKSERRAP